MARSATTFVKGEKSPLAHQRVCPPSAGFFMPRPSTYTPELADLICAIHGN